MLSSVLNFRHRDVTIWLKWHKHACGPIFFILLKVENQTFSLPVCGVYFILLCYWVTKNSTQGLIYVRELLHH